jgi:hypothetical protein
VWIRSDRLRERRVRPEDCFPVNRFQIIDKPPITLSFARDIWGGFGQRQSLIEVLKKSGMVYGGRWVWQADKPLRAPNRNMRAQAGPGRGAGGPQHPRPPPPPPMQQQQYQR